MPVQPGIDGVRTHSLGGWRWLFKLFFGGSRVGETVLSGRVGWYRGDCLQFTINIFLNSANFAIQTLREPKTSPSLLLVKGLDAKN